MDKECSPEIMTITDEDGVEYEMKILQELQYQGSKYYALAPVDTADYDELEVSILKAVDEDGKEVLYAVEDENELEAVYAKLVDELFKDD